MNVTDQPLRRAWGTARDDKWIVDDAGELWRFDGKTWGMAARDGRVYAIGGSAPNDVFAVGAAGFVTHYDGTRWTEQQSAATNNLLDVWAKDATDVFACGSGGGLVHYDGKVWTKHDSHQDDALKAVWGMRHDDVYVVGNGGIRRRYREHPDGGR